MDSLWLQAAVLLAGAGIAAYGGVVLATGRLSERQRAAFGSSGTLGRYSLFSGLSLIFLGLGTMAGGLVTAAIGLVLALITAGIAFQRYRPGRARSGR